MNDVTIRPCSEADLDGLLDLFAEVAEERIWIGTEPGCNVVGSLSVHPDSEHDCRIGMLVKPGYRGKGIGSALLGEAVQWARRQNQATISLLVFPHNAAAIALYERHGFKETGRHRAFVKRQTGDVCDAIAMTLQL